MMETARCERRHFCMCTDPCRDLRDSMPRCPLTGVWVQLFGDLLPAVPCGAALVHTPTLARRGGSVPTFSAPLGTSSSSRALLSWPGAELAQWAPHTRESRPPHVAQLRLPKTCGGCGLARAADDLVSIAFFRVKCIIFTNLTVTYP